MLVQDENLKTERAREQKRPAVLDATPDHLSTPSCGHSGENLYRTSTYQLMDSIDTAIVYDQLKCSHTCSSFWKEYTCVYVEQSYTEVCQILNL